MRVRTKICGITRVEDALAAVSAGADAIGLVFYEPSARYVTIDMAKQITEALPPFISVVALFVNATSSEVNAVLSKVSIDLLQFHGDETEAACSQYNLPYMKAVRVKSDTNLIQYAKDYSSANALLLDTYSDQAVGGTGLTFDWDLIPTALPLPIVLAGGLTADNVATAISQVKPYAVDVSGGVEVTKGIKDAKKITAFLTQVTKGY